MNYRGSTHPSAPSRAEIIADGYERAGGSQPHKAQTDERRGAKGGTISNVGCATLFLASYTKRDQRMPLDFKETSRALWLAGRA